MANRKPNGLFYGTWFNRSTERGTVQQAGGHHNHRCCLQGTRAVAAGVLRAHAISTKNRSPLMPEVPTMAESGVPG